MDIEKLHNWQPADLTDLKATDAERAICWLLAKTTRTSAVSAVSRGPTRYRTECDGRARDVRIRR
jgi:hypothetical protein